ncbi:MAG TPA: PilZ domain-containing protein [Steroidobacteraceae bacterium]|jgi:hypothetical protein
MEHRCGARYPLDLPVHARTQQGVSAVGSLYEISLSGGFLRTRVAMRPHSRISLEIIDRDRRTARYLRGRIVRHTSTGFGIEWDEYVPNEIRFLAERSLLEQPNGPRVHLRLRSGARTASAAT